MFEIVITRKTYFVADDCCQAVLIVGHRQNSGKDKDLPAREDKRIRHRRIHHEYPPLRPGLH
jgi:hypothetical protein